MPSPLLELRNVIKRFPGVVAMDDISVDFRPGEVHAVIGENGAGKSTMMNVLAGSLQPNEGTIRVDGAETVFASPLASQAAGIRVVFQELSLCWNLTVGENVMLPALARRSPLSPMASRRAGHAAVPVLDRLGLSAMDPETPLERLTVAQQQLVEIARAISQNARVLVLDEPNSALSPEESARLFDVVRELRAEGVCIIYVSHHLDEVLDLADRISVMRDGRLVTTFDKTHETTTDELVSHMVGREMETSDQYALRKMTEQAKETVLSVSGLSVPGELDDVHLEVAAGEIVGIAGLPDSGTASLADAIFGTVPRRGAVSMNGIRLAPGRPAHSIAAGMAYIPADRRGAGALLSMSVAENTVASALGRFLQRGFLRWRPIRDTTDEYVAKLDAKVASLGQAIATLSGGNQQKIILARGLVTGPKLLILHEPTRGIDVGAKAEIYDILKSLAEQGMAILMISSEMPELILHTGRVVVLAEGRVSGQLTGADITEETIMSLATVSHRRAA